MGIARALQEFNPELRAKMKAEGFMTRDARQKERKKYGQKAPASASSSASVKSLAGSGSPGLQSCPGFVFRFSSPALQVPAAFGSLLCSELKIFPLPLIRGRQRELNCPAHS